jgi:molybdopterin-guanine dinucleotide biosynthesis protein A
LKQLLSIYILAGGRSSRMGTDKGLIQLGNKKVIEYILETCLNISTDIFIVTSNTNYQQFKFPLIQDQIIDAGPAGGIDTILQHTSAEYNLVISCDMPFVDVYSMQYLIDHSTNKLITIPILNQYPEAMFGIYQKECKNKWRELLNQQYYKMSELIAHFNPNFVDGNQMQDKNPILFANLNTPEDLLNVEQWLKK